MTRHSPPCIQGICVNHVNNLAGASAIPNGKSDLIIGSMSTHGINARALASTE
jgi:hypothetical protein